MIYLLSNDKVRYKAIIVKNLSYLPTDNNQSISTANDQFQYLINNRIFADILTVPDSVDSTELEIDNMIKYNFSDYVVKVFDSVDFFSAYLIYIMSSNN